MLIIAYEPITWRPACIAMGVFFTSGALGFFLPVQGAHLYGLPITTESEATFYPAVSCRNVSLGLTILALVATGQPKALGTVLLGFSVMALGDMVVVLGSPGVPPGSMAMHATKLVGMPLVGGRLLGLW